VREKFAAGKQNWRAETVSTYLHQHNLVPTKMTRMIVVSLPVIYALSVSSVWQLMVNYYNLFPPAENIQA
jgi:hypothetical protein